MIRWTAAALALLSLAGCVRQTQWGFTLTPTDRGLEVETDGVDLLFEGQLPGGGRDAETCTVTVAGGGGHRAVVAVGGLSFETTYEDGVCAITFGEHRVYLLDGGKRLQVGSQEFGLVGEKKTIAIAADGSAEERG